MTTRLRLLVPGLFEASMLQTLIADAKQLHNQLIAGLKQADYADLKSGDLYAEHYHLTEQQRQYVPWLVPVELRSKQLMFRADPVILQPTHNGILCRGNDILHLDPDEQRDIETTFNDYFAERGLTLTFYAPAEAIVTIAPEHAELADVAFSSLAQVLGQDLTHHLPTGVSGRDWQTILMETQMLLHRTETNQQRTESGEKTVGSLWFWGCNNPDSTELTLNSDMLFTDSRLLLSAFADRATKLGEFQQTLTHSGSVDVVIEQLAQASLQNDPQRWQNAFASVVKHYIFPALQAISDKSLSQLEILSETAHYTLKPWHKLRFWR